MKILSKVMFLCLAVMFAQLSFSETKVIANKGTGVSSLSSKEVAKAFLGKINVWKSGAKVDPCLLEASDEEMSAFYQEILGKSVAAYQAYWNRLLFSGKAAPPESFSSHSDLVNFVSNNKGAICFTNSADGLPGNVVVLQ